MLFLMLSYNQEWKSSWMLAKGSSGQAKYDCRTQEEALFEQLDLSSLDSWTSKSRAAAHILLAEYHDIFSLNSCEFGYMDLP